MGLNKVYIKITRENIYKDEFCIKKSLSPTHTVKHWPFFVKKKRDYDLRQWPKLHHVESLVQLCFLGIWGRSSNRFLFQTPVTRISHANEEYRTTFYISVGKNVPRGQQCKTPCVRGFWKKLETENILWNIRDNVCEGVRVSFYRVRVTTDGSCGKESVQ